MEYNESEMRKALDYLATYYEDRKVNNNMTVIYAGEHKKVSKEIKYTSMKQSVYKNVDFSDCIFENVACTGSSYEDVTFANSTLTGNSFANCDFLRTTFDGTEHVYEANNFSQSSFETCSFTGVKLFRSGMLNALFHGCLFTKTQFRGSTIEGTKFAKCKFTDCDFGNVNIDYTMFTGNDYHNVTFPFYQLAFIIGMTDMLADPNAKIFALVGERKIGKTEYKKQLHNLKLYYLDKSEIFPVCNICLAQNNRDEAKQYLIQGVENAIATRNFRLISNFCRLACYHGIVDENIRNRINHAMDSFIQSENVLETQLNYYLTYIGKIQTMLKEGASKKVTLHYKITTNAGKTDEADVLYVNQLIADLNQELTQIDGIDGYNVTISNYSPFEIAVGIVTIFGVAFDVSKTVLGSLLNRRKEKREKKEKEAQEKKRIEHEIENGVQMIDAQIEAAKEKILLLQRDFNGKALDKRIVAVTQSLQTDLEEFYTKQIMYFTKHNPDASKD